MDEKEVVGVLQEHASTSQNCHLIWHSKESKAYTWQWPSKESKVCMSVMGLGGEKCEHFEIIITPKNDNNTYTLKDKAFSTVSEMLEHYQKNPIGQFESIGDAVQNTR